MRFVMLLLTPEDREYLFYFLEGALENLTKNQGTLDAEKFNLHEAFLQRIIACVRQ